MPRREARRTRDRDLDRYTGLNPDTASTLKTGPVETTMPSGARAPRTFYPTSLLRIQQKSSGPLTRSGSRTAKLRTSLRISLRAFVS